VLEAKPRTDQSERRTELRTMNSELHVKLNTNRVRRTQKCERAVCSSPRGAMHILREHLYVFDGCRRKDAVAQIEDMPGTAGNALQNVLGLIEHTPRRAAPQRGVHGPPHRP